MAQPDDPYAVALAAFRDPPGGTAAERLMARFDAYMTLRRIRRLEVAAAWFVLAAVIIGAGWWMAHVPFPG